MPEFNEKPQINKQPEDVFNMTNPVPEGVDPEDFWDAVDLLDSRYGGKEKYKPGRPESLHTKTDETYLEKLVRETRQKLPELIVIIHQARKEGVPQKYHELTKQTLEKTKEETENTEKYN